MNKSIKYILTALVLVIGFAWFQTGSKTIRLGSDGGQTNYSAPTAAEYNQVGLTASRSQQGIVKANPGRVFAIEVTSDATSLRYLQLFDQLQAVVPTRAASKSTTYSLKIYKASQSWALAANLDAKPLGSYQQYASPSLIVSIPIPPATASNTPTVIRIDSTMFSPARAFAKGIMWGISTAFGSYASPSTVTTPAQRHTVKIIYE